MIYLLINFIQLLNNLKQVMKVNQIQNKLKILLMIQYKIVILVKILHNKIINHHKKH